MMNSLTGKHALVTGGGSGIGAAVALALADAGATVTICGRRREQLDTTAARHKNIHAEAADVTDRQSLARLYEAAQAARGKFDIVVANAGGAQSSPAEKISTELWTNTLNVNLTGAFYSVQPALAAMRAKKWGRIVFVASTAGIRAAPYIAPYVAAKHGVIGLMRTLALETAKDGITVNAVCPSYTETPMLEQAVARIVATTKRSAAEARAALAAKNPQGRFITPQEVADTVLWLCGDSSASITGQAISLSGGETW
jgi:NAD(P)-dependent dehydrogenase (short-subunit alcohol dehydrogenase family)